MRLRLNSIVNSWVALNSLGCRARIPPHPAGTDILEQATTTMVLSKGHAKSEPVMNPSAALAGDSDEPWRPFVQAAGVILILWGLALLTLAMIGYISSMCGLLESRGHGNCLALLK